MIIDKLFAPAEPRGLGNPSVPLSTGILDLFGARSASGITVGPNDALSYSPIWQAVALISGDVAKIKIETFEETSAGMRRAVDHPVDTLLRKWTGELPAALWVQSVMANALLYGSGYSIIKRDAVGQAVALEFVPSAHVYKHRIPGERNAMAYEVRDDDGPPIPVPSSEMFCLDGLTFSAYGGLSVVQYARNTIGRMLASEGYADDFFSNAAVPSGFFSHPGQMSPEAQTRFLEGIKQRHGSAGKRHRAGILEEGMQYAPSAITPEDAMLVQMLAMGVNDVSRFFNLPPHKLGAEGRTSFNSVEQENRSYFSSSLGAWVARFEAAINCSLFPMEQWATHHAKFDTDQIFRADLEARMKSNAVAIVNGIKSRNEVRAEENLNPYDGGDEYLVPLNLGASDDVGEQDETLPQVADPPEPTDDRAALVVEAQRELIISDVQSAARKIVRQATDAARKPESFLSFVNTVRTEKRERMFEEIWPALHLAFVASGVGDVQRASKRACQMLIETIEEQLLKAAEVQPEDLAASVADVLPRVHASCRAVVVAITKDEVY